MKVLNNPIRNKIEKLAKASGIAVYTYIVYSNSGIDKKGGEVLYKQLCTSCCDMEGKLNQLKIN